MKFKRSTQDIEAIQFTGTNHAEVFAWLASFKTKLGESSDPAARATLKAQLARTVDDAERAEPTDEDGILLIRTKKKTLRVNTNDYVVLTQSLDLLTIDDALFDFTFDPAEKA